ncbi:asialoglycoprotein receptor 2 isoform X1 [Loxodonta africana]|uniref:asialoglycoprotein receptor 2-like isoform X1 n=1 Tax=Elephas maximus indicus TaxID=99487 RepID=UPI0021169A9C|nr:asialoglycoprotein receptor 2-like isoform X1 [Elephas maximus indicus]
MVKDFQDIQQLDSEENDHQLDRSEGPRPRRHNLRRENPFWEGTPPPQPFLQRFCSRPRLSLLALGFNVLLLVVICMIGSQSEYDSGGSGTQLQMELRALKETFNNFSVTTLTEVRALNFHGVNVSDRVTFLEANLEKQNEDLKSDHANLLLHLKQFPVDLRILECHITFFQSNGRGTKCCPVNWMEHDGSCYWFSRSGKTWSEADKYCQLEDAHLVVINSKEEQQFILQHASPFHTWLGLTSTGGSWKWVDGTDYENGYKNWAYTQPDNWQGREVGGSEDCVEIQSNGQWNDDLCLQMHRWVCETRKNHTTGSL